MVCGTEEGTTDWSSATEQRERPERDRFIALLFGLGFRFGTRFISQKKERFLAP